MVTFVFSFLKALYSNGELSFPWNLLQLRLKRKTGRFHGQELECYLVYAALDTETSGESKGVTSRRAAHISVNFLVNRSAVTRRRST